MPDIDYSPLPEHLRDGAQRYVEQGVATGSFLRSVFENDFAMAVVRADDKCALVLPDIARWLANEAPGDCWGSKAMVSGWMRAGGLLGVAAKRAEV